MFRMSFHDAKGILHDIGEIKIGFIGQTIEVETHQKIPNSFTNLSDEYFSLGQSLEFYRKMALLPKNLCENILTALRDIVLQPEIIAKIKDEEVFGASLLRGTSLSVVKGQFSRVLAGKAELTDFKFKFIRPESVEFVGIDISFSVEEDSTPSTNIHAIIGRNGVGKTTLLNGMIKAITDQLASSKFFNISQWSEKEIEKDYFSSLVSVSFSAFDPFPPPQEQPDPAKGTCYFYIGLKDPKDGTRHRAIPELQEDCAKARRIQN